MTRRLFVLKKTGFKNNPNIPVIIRDFRGILFYTTEYLGKPVNEFNLPKGEYMVDSGQFTPMSNPVYYPLISLPARERWYPNPKKFKVVFGYNPHKCSIIWGAKTILFSDKLKDAPLYVIDFILFHEFSHACYSTEKYADLMSANFMKKRGYNPSQIGSAPLDTLSGGAYDRKVLLLEKLTRFK